MNLSRNVIRLNRYKKQLHSCNKFNKITSSGKYSTGGSKNIVPQFNSGKSGVGTGGAKPLENRWFSNEKWKMQN